MNRHKLILIRDQSLSRDDAATLGRQTLAHLSQSSQPHISHLTVCELLSDPTQVDGVTGVAWLMVDDAGAGDVFDAIGLLQDRHLPMMVSCHRQPSAAMQHDGVVVCPPEGGAAAAAAVLQALSSQVPVLRALLSEVKLLQRHEGGLCDQIGRIDEELRLAAQLQREFLPKKLVGVGGVSFRVIFRPAGYVSGDIYDVARLDEEHLAFFLADAIGHGVPAALLTMFIKRSLQTKVIDASMPRGYRLLEPAESLRRLNQDLLQMQGGQVRFATACYGIVNCRTRELRVARAGHPLPLLLRQNGRTLRLEPEGGLLGIFPKEQYEQAHVHLRDGDRLLVYSDGFEMAFAEPADDIGPSSGEAPHRRIASHRYIQEFEGLRHGTMETALNQLQERLDIQAGSLNQRDDLTLLCMEVTSEAASLIAAA